MTKEEYEQAHEKLVARIKELDEEMVTDPMFGELNKLIEKQRYLLQKTLNQLEKSRL